ncbi:MAG TPA: GNAT family N-acetyltransferase [Candidatus Omnitrophota bacterium]|nr:GNAT family N-acetyltransferase [Candidatus Omnitrophota bacterium]
MRVQAAGHGSEFLKWDAYAVKHPRSTVYHLSAWRKIAVRNYGAVDRSIVCMDGDRIAGLVPLLRVQRFGGGNYLTSGIFGAYDGILADSAQVRDLLIDETVRIAGRDASSFAVIKDYAEGEYPGFVTNHDYVTYVLDLTGGRDAAWKRLQCNTRNHVRKGQKTGVTCDIGTGKLADFLRIYAVNIRDLGTPFPGAGFFEDLIREFNDHAAIVTVSHGQKALGAGLLLDFKDTMYIPFSATLKAYREYCPGNVLFWEAIEYACSRGCGYFDFGRSSLNSGTAQFKKQWGASDRQLYYKYRMSEGKRQQTFNPNDPQYRACSALWRLLPVWAANRIGPALIRHIV